MGVFTVGRQVALEIDMPGWWLANAAVDMDFRRGLYYDSSTANPRAATDFLSCVRASVGYAKTAEGTLTSFASNTLRITSAGLLCEDARTNICLDSQTLGAGNFTLSGVTVTVDATTAPDGTTTADKQIPNGSQPVEYQSVSGSAAQTTWTAYFKNAGFNYGCLSAAEGSNRYCILVNLTTGVIETTNTVGSPSVTSSSVETLANGWYRLQVTLNAASGSQFILLAQSDTASPTFANNTPNNVTPSGSNGVYIWGAQVEVGAFASSYIPTTGAAATRAAENITTSGSLQTAINTATGSLVAQTDNGGGTTFAANIVDSNGTNLLGFNASNNALASMIGTLATGNTANRTTQDKLGLAWNASGRSLVLNGGTVVNDASAQTPSATQHIGSTGTTNFIYAYVERISAFTTKLADATLQGFTV